MTKQTGLEKKTSSPSRVPGDLPLCDLRAFLVPVTLFLLLINPSPSRCGFDAVDGGAVLILSPKKF